MKRRHFLAGAASVLAAPHVARATTRPFRFTTNWYAQAEHAGFYQALARGFYRDAGLEVEIAHGGPQVNDMQLLLAGNCDMILGGAGEAMIAQGRSMPVVTVATTFAHALAGLVVHPDIHTMADLKGHTILLSTEVRATTWPLLKAKFGFTDAQVRPYTFNIQPFVLDPTIAMQAFATSEPYALQQAKVPYRFLSFSDVVATDYGNPLLTTAPLIAERRADIAAFLAASMRGWADWMSADPGPANDAIRADNPQMSLAQIMWSRQRFRDTAAFGPNGGFYGRLDPARAGPIHDALIAAGQIGPGDSWKAACDYGFAPAMESRIA
ncbi:NitT/TauT family transport system substrate-binding protein [Endobacter medicaginis]|uniref:ABC transporter substrate-binding protein n=1 Tax=Endobacter medicaginis TaxID=1181271 RepID=A0A850NVD6_9PROT|nr:ABC transporter substrate-binding protein [Endobacter medicaginis]MBB3173428.1 NitT/TauT family transport system substrate-binding protein [Endobacter medicaginis]MCX5475474.1 ABC transporter substrate-binding protein [Endobacter medicaginis]NVN31465.1 ABC transporter substrate-binding protein [Endobacter medicaginis]